VCARKMYPFFTIASVGTRSMCAVWYASEIPHQGPMFNLIVTQERRAAEALVLYPKEQGED